MYAQYYDLDCILYGVCGGQEVMKTNDSHNVRHGYALIGCMYIQ